MVPTRKGIVLFAHGARNPDWRRPIEAIAAAMQARDPRARIEIGFLEFLAPSLPEAIDRLAGEGIRAIVVVPIFMAQSGHTKRDLPQLLESASRRHDGLSIEVATPIGEAGAVVAAIAQYALRCAEPPP
jgi:sirohydrochlorin cobaltochelatase